MPDDCRSCRGAWRECTRLKPWFDYAEIRFCPYQCMWIIANASGLREGAWPSDPDNPIDDVAGGDLVASEAIFCMPVLIIAEVEQRLERTGIAGKLLVAQVEAGCTLDMLDREARAALMYIKGYRRKLMPFIKWRWQARKQENKDILSSKCTRVGT